MIYDLFIKVTESGLQVPQIRMSRREYAVLEDYFNAELEAHDLGFISKVLVDFDSLNDKIISVPYNDDLVINELEENQKMSRLLRLELENLLNLKTNEVSSDMFVLDLIKVGTVEKLFPAFGVLDQKFEEIQLVSEDVISIKIRGSKVLVSGYFLDAFEPFFIDSTEFISFLKDWKRFLAKWYSSEIPNLKYDESVSPRLSNICYSPRYLP